MVTNAEDVLLWDDGFWIFRFELGPEFSHRSDCFQVIPYQSPHWFEIAQCSFEIDAPGDQLR